MYKYFLSSFKNTNFLASSESLINMHVPSAIKPDIKKYVSRKLKHLTLCSLLFWNAISMPFQQACNFTDFRNAISQMIMQRVENEELKFYKQKQKAIF